MNEALSDVNFTNILRAVFCQFPFAKKVQTKSVSTKKIKITFLYEKNWSQDVRAKS